LWPDDLPANQPSRAFCTLFTSTRRWGFGYHMGRWRIEMAA